MQFSTVIGTYLFAMGIGSWLSRFINECLGQPFNPEEQDALSMTADSEVPANHVLTEYAKGYRFKDRMLRHAQVVVSSGPAA